MNKNSVVAVFALVGLLAGPPLVAFGDVTSRPESNPASAPLKTIIEVRSSVLCQTLRKGVQPALAGLMKNDSLIEAANRGAAKMFDDQTAQATGSGQMDRLYLHDVASALSRNLTTIAQILNQGFSTDTSATDASQDIRNRLQTIALAQNDALNLIEGTLQSEEIGRAKDEFVGGHQSGASEVATGSIHAQVIPNLDMQGFRAEFHNADDPATPYIQNAGLGSGLYHPPPRVPDRARNLPALIHLTRARITDLEGYASVAILAAAKACGSP